jgi:hypothetical protein
MPGHASIPDRKSGERVLEAVCNAYARLQHIWANQGYTGTLVRWAEQEHGWAVQFVCLEIGNSSAMCPTCSTIWATNQASGASQKDGLKSEHFLERTAARLSKDKEDADLP